MNSNNNETKFWEIMEDNTEKIDQIKYEKRTVKAQLKPKYFLTFDEFKREYDHILKQYKKPPPSDETIKMHWFEYSKHHLESAFDEIFDKIMKRKNENMMYRLHFYTPATDWISTPPLLTYKYSARVMLDSIERILQSHDQILISDGIQLHLRQMEITKRDKKKLAYQHLERLIIQF